MCCDVLCCAVLQTEEGFGFNVMGGSEQKCPLYISRIIPNGYADRHGQLRRGDQLISVNGVVSVCMVLVCVLVRVWCACVSAAM